MTELTTPDELTARMNYARALAESNLLPAQYRKQPANVLVAIEYGQALGLAPMVAIQTIHVVDGKPTASAQLIGGLVRRAGHQLRIKGDATSATAVIVRSDDPEFNFSSTWTIERATAAGLLNKAGSSWHKYPDAMLKARAITEVARDACPEVLNGVAYTAEELGADPEITTAQPNWQKIQDEPKVMTIEQVQDLAAEYLEEIEDAEIVEDNRPPQRRAARVTEKQLIALDNLLDRLGRDNGVPIPHVGKLDLVSDFIGVRFESLEQLEVNQASRVIADLKENGGRMQEVFNKYLELRQAANRGE